MHSNRDVYIIGGVRTPFARAFGSLASYTNRDLMVHVLNELINKYQMHGMQLGEVALGAVLKDPRDYNLARDAVLSTQLDPKTPGIDIQRACATSLSTLVHVALKIKTGQIDCGIAGGVDSISQSPVSRSEQSEKGTKVLLSNKASKISQALHRLKNFPDFPTFIQVEECATGLSMGESMELTARKWKIHRDDQDKYAYASHQKALSGARANFFDSIVPLNGLDHDDNVRESSLEKLAQLKTVFSHDKEATLTAGNSTALTDGAAAILLGTKDWAEKNNLPLIAKFKSFDESAIEFSKSEELLLGPAYSIPKLLLKNNLTLDDIDFFEIHEAFAAQTLCVMKALNDQYFLKNNEALEIFSPIESDKINTYGGSLAVGHPFAATGSRLILSLAKQLGHSTKKYGLASSCTAGGMAVSVLLESLY